MPDGLVDPATLEGDDLIRWYRRSPWEIEQQRQAALRQQYNQHFGVNSGASHAQDQQVDSTDPDDGSVASSGLPAQAPAPTTFPIPSTVNGYVPGLLGDLSGLTGSGTPQVISAAPTGQDGGPSPPGDQQPAAAGADQQSSPYFDTGLATGADSVWLPVGGKMPKIRRQWSAQEGRDWPKVPETGRNYDGHHKVPKSEGGQDVLENIEPMHPIDHRDLHMKNGDFSKWASWARGGKPTLPEVPGLGILQIIPDIAGILSGRIRMDSLDNFFSDMLGIPSQEDIRQYHEQRRKVLAPDSPPGTIVEEL